MADPTIRIKRSSVEGKIPTPDQLPTGEVALNTFDGKFYASKNVGIGTTVFAVNPWTVGTGTNTYNTFFTNGNVGIGTTNPTSKLYVQGDGRFTGVVTAISFVGNGSNLSGIVTQIVAGSNITIDPVGGTGSVTINSSGGSGGTSSQWTTVAAGIHTSSNVGIKTENPTSVLHVIGNTTIVGVLTSTDYNTTSDKNLKTNIFTISNPLEKISKLNGVTFNWIETNKSSVGVIAQEVEKVFPELVGGDTTKTVNYNGLIGLLIESIKEQQAQINSLKIEIDYLKNK
jgi:hypothetical protein